MFFESFPGKCNAHLELRATMQDKENLSDEHNIMDSYIF